MNKYPLCKYFVSVITAVTITPAMAVTGNAKVKNHFPSVIYSIYHRYNITDAKVQGVNITGFGCENHHGSISAV